MNTILKSIIIIVPVLISVAFFTLLERKIMANIQRRRGPNVVGILGILQPFADGLKLLIEGIELCSPYDPIKETLELKLIELELERTNKSLININKDLDNFVHTASHDLLARLLISN